jgi:hypothetical protein
MAKDGDSERHAAMRQKVLAWIVALALLLGLAFANARLVHVAVTSAPGCVPHRAIGQLGPGPAPYAAAGSSCTPR